MLTTYIRALIFAFSRNLIYPYEIIASIIAAILKTGFLIIFWNLIISDSGGEVTIKSLASYFLMADGLGRILMSGNTMLGRTIRKNVQYGSISSYLLKPINVPVFLYMVTVGKQGMQFIIGIISILIGIIIYPLISIESLLLFVLFIIPAFFIAIAFNQFEGALSFIFTEVSGFKNALAHITRMLSGALIPLYYFPENLRRIIELTPFPAMNYGPTNALQTAEITADTFKELAVSYFWAFILVLLVFGFWNKVIKNYEAVGI